MALGARLFPGSTTSHEGSNPRLQDKRGHDAMVKLLRRAPWTATRRRREQPTRGKREKYNVEMYKNVYPDA